MPADRQARSAATKRRPVTFAVRLVFQDTVMWEDEDREWFKEEVEHFLQQERLALVECEFEETT